MTRHNGSKEVISLKPEAHAQYETYCDIRLAPVSPESEQPDDSDEQQPAAAQADAQQPAAGALQTPVPQPTIDPIETATPLPQKEFFEDVLLEVLHGDRPAYKDWKQLEVAPPEAICCLPCQGSDAFAVKPIRFWSHEKWGIETPCANHGGGCRTTPGRRAV